MKIMDRVRYVKQVVTEDYANEGTLGSEMQRLGVAALLKGRQSTEWSDFMRIFADNKEQLARLTGDTELDPHANEGWVRESSAYLVAGTPCGGMSPLHFEYLMNEDIDLGLPTKADGTIERPIAIPEPPAPEGDPEDGGGDNPV